MSVTAELMNEHRLIERMLTVIEYATDDLDDGKPVKAKVFEEAVDFVQNFADGVHHAKEEATLFPRMEERGVPNEGGPIGTMIEEHEEGRELIREIAANIDLYDAGDPAAGKVIVESGRSYVGLLRQHIDKEDDVLFVMADQVLTDDDQAELTVRFAEIEEQMLGSRGKNRYINMVERYEVEFGIA